MSNQIKELRKIKNLSQSAFGEKLGVSRDVINNLENGRVDLKENMIITICSVFNVNREWLVSGEGPISPDNLNSMIDLAAKELELSANQKALVELFFSMDKDEREIIAHAFFSMAAQMNREKISKERSSLSNDTDVEKADSVLRHA